MKSQQPQGENTDPKNKEEQFPGYPHYAPGEDIYRQEKEEIDIDPETKEKKKTPQEDNNPGLDIPGAELDDEQEDVGSEDEENNYYSLGGDDHDNLEESRE